MKNYCVASDNEAARENKKALAFLLKLKLSILVFFKEIDIFDVV